MIKTFFLFISRDVLCGKLACVWPQKNPFKTDVRSAVYLYTQGHVCITTGLSVRSGGRDYAYVADGTVCGAQMYCVNKTCKEVPLMGYNCDATEKCKGNGVNITLVKKGYKTHQSNWLTLSFYIVLPFFVFFTTMIIKRNEMRKVCNRENAEYEG
ncbi:Disintegrin and metalloproteinase domain-containing protein 18 [Camelus dromedarius]|uniref:Disintegrin and metalloproteinase domain-containing protein 18 n=1 Tax=Camelus dromedarius TaxID=9838 RepID=A0A5N4CFM6_CAMDR|nr:Disintegrin and metalloproteinase domain-containing protein 18 [Camelus dromedarius]